MLFHLLLLNSKIIVANFQYADRDIFPLCKHAVSGVGKPDPNPEERRLGYPGGLITRRAVVQQN